MTEIACLSWLYLQTHALRIIIQQYMYQFLSCYILVLFQILDCCLLKIIDACQSITTKTWQCLEQTSFFKSMSSSSQYFFKSKIVSQTSFSRNVFPYLCMCRISIITVIFFKACVHYLLFFH